MGAHHFWATSVPLDMLPYIVVSSLTPYSSLILFPFDGVRCGRMAECVGFGTRKAWCQILALLLTSCVILVRWLLWACLFIYKITTVLGTRGRPRKMAAVFFTAQLRGEDKTRWLTKGIWPPFTFHTVPCGWTARLWTFSLGGSTSRSWQVPALVRTSVAPVVK